MITPRVIVVNTRSRAFLGTKQLALCLEQAQRPRLLASLTLSKRVWMPDINVGATWSWPGR